MKKKLFICPSCQKNLGFKNVIHVSDHHDLICPHCSNVLTPEKTKTWLWGYGIGLLSVLIPAKLYLTFGEDNIMMALIIGAACGATAVFGICLYLYFTTTFRIK